MSGLTIAWIAYLAGLISASAALRLSLPPGRGYTLAVGLGAFLLVIPWRVVEDRLDWWGPALPIALFDITLGDADASWVLRPIGIGLGALVLALVAGTAGWLWWRRRSGRGQGLPRPRGRSSS